MTQLKWLENILYSSQGKSFPGEKDEEVSFISFPVPQSTCKGKKKSNVSQLSSIVISQEANKRNNTMEMDLHNNTWAYALRHFSRPRGETKPAFFCTAVFLHVFLM